MSDNCIDSAGPLYLSLQNQCEAIMDFRQRGIRHRVITEINKENISYCRELMEFVDELRHIDGIKDNFSVSERDYQATAII
jgi:two-component system, OmpR family, sensor histidine kinase VicK